MTTARLSTFAALLVGLALAATNPLPLSASVGGGWLGLVAGVLPKGWFSSRNTFDRTKTNLVAEYSLGATACSGAASGTPLSSLTQGTFSAELNPAGQATGYWWDANVDLTAWENHWAYRHLCDGSVVVSGCPEVVPVTTTVTAYDPSGACRTWVNDQGQTVCATTSGRGGLPAVRDPDVYDTCAPPSCGIGPCVSACQHACQTLTDRAQRQACQTGCSCQCKLQLPLGCPAHPECGAAPPALRPAPARR